MPSIGDQLATAWASLRAGNPLGAERIALEIVQANPRHPEAWHLLGSARISSSRPADAETAFRKAISLRPDDPIFHRSLGDALWNLNRLDEAEASYRASLGTRPDEPGTLANLALVLAEQGRVAEALTHFDHALQLDPSNRQTRHNRSLSLLLRGDYPRGWAEYESRWGSESLPIRPFPQALWNGSPLGGKTILLHAEQGLGDTLQFLRYVPLVRLRGGRIILVVQPALRRLLEGFESADVLISQGDPIPPFDLHCPLLSLPRLFGTTIESIPSRVPYLAANPDRLTAWRRQLAAIGGFKIGIAWQGNPKYRRDRDRSFPLEQFAPLASLPGVTLISLQVGPGREQISVNRERVPLVDLAEQIDRDGPFLDTAAVMASLDLVITPDTVLAHLAGALGIPIWIAVNRVPHWTWLLDRQDSPWYPTARLFRQTTRGDWNPVFHEIAAAVASMPPRPIHVEIAPGELFDKIAILQIKADRIADPAKLQNVLNELSDLRSARDRALRVPVDLGPVLSELDAVNLAIWNVEDDLRLCERVGDFGPRFIELARSVYRNNDRRAALKRLLNERFRSRLIEEKSYQAEQSRS